MKSVIRKNNMPRNIFEHLFSVRNDNDKIHKNITIFGANIKVKRWKYRKIKFTGKSQNCGVAYIAILL